MLFIFSDIRSQPVSITPLLTLLPSSFFLQTYVKSQDKAFAAATIQAIGRCATNISEVTDTCLNGLVLLLSNRDGNKPSSGRHGSAGLVLIPTSNPRRAVFTETVVAESVVVIKKLLQTQPTQHSEIIKHMAKLFDNITVRPHRPVVVPSAGRGRGAHLFFCFVLGPCRCPWPGPASCG